MENLQEDIKLQKNRCADNVSNFSNYFKCDLHIHTDYSNKTKSNDYKGIFDVQKLIEQISTPEHDIKMLSFTDHNIINTDAYKEYYNDKSLNIDNRCLLVGVELDIILEEYLFEKIEAISNGSSCDREKYHSIIIFKSNDVDCLNGKLNEMYKEISTDYNEKHEEKIDLNDEKQMMKRITSFDRFANIFIDEDYLVISHGNKKANIKDAYESYENGLNDAQVMVILGIVDALEMSPGNNKRTINHFNRGFQSLLNDDYSAKNEIPYVVFSDNHEIAAYPKYKNSQTLNNIFYTWIKGDLSFETLRMSFVDPISRIFVSSDQPKSPDKYIEKITFNTVNNGVEKGQTIIFSPGINTIVGGRSSGKSMLFNSILYTLSNGRDKSKIDDYTKKGNVVLDKSSVKTKLNCDIDFKANNICELNAYTQEGIIDLFENNGEGLKDHLNFEQLNMIEIHEKTNKYNAMIDSFITAYSDLLSKKNNYQSDIPIATFKEASKKINEKYIYKDVINDLRDVEIKSSDITYIIEKITNGIENAKAIKESELGGISIFNDEEQKIIIAYLELLKNKRIEMDDKYHIFGVREIFLKNLEQTLNGIANKYLTEESARIEAAKKQEGDELKKIHDYFKAKMVFKKCCRDISDASIKIDEKNRVISDNYTLNTKVDCEINIDFLNEILFDRINNFNKNQSLESNFLNLIDNKINVKRKGNSSEDVKSVFIQIKNSINESLTPKYTIIERNNSISLNSDNMSHGKKASIYLEIILEECKNHNSIIMIDQPEDNIDNAFITDILIDKIRELRMRNQIILVSHNAAIAINSDSDNIIVSENNNGDFSYETGGLEKVQHRNKVCKLLDGGNYIFDNRYHKYNIFNNKVNEPLRKGEIEE